MTGPFTEHHCGLYRPANNGDNDCGVCGWDEASHLPHFRNGEEVADYLSRATVGSRLVYHGAIHTVIDAGPEQGFRVAASRKG